MERDRVNRSISRQLSTRVVEDVNYPSTFVANLSKVFGDDPTWLSDVKFVVEDEEIPGHRIVLAVFSDYFRGLFKMDQSDKIMVHDIGKDVFKAILSFAYTGKISISTENVQDLLVAANYYGCTGLVEKASEFMSDFMEKTNVLDIWELADPLSLQKLCESCRVFAVNNFDGMMEDPDVKSRLLGCSPRIIEEILKSENLILRHPDTKLLSYADEREKAVIKWVKIYCSNGKKRDASALLRNCVNWDCLSSTDVAELLGELAVNDANEAEKMLNAATERKYSLRKLAALDLDEQKGLVCSIGHPIVIVDENGCDLFQTPLKEPKQLFLGCDCDRKRSEAPLSNTVLSTRHVLTREQSVGSLEKRWFPKPIDFWRPLVRSYACSCDYVSQPMADGGQVGRPGESFVQIAGQNEYITELTITTRLWDGREVVDGIGIKFSSGRFEEHGGGGGGAVGSHTVHLRTGEHIVNMSANSGWMIDSFVFEIGKLQDSNLVTRKVGPFGGDGGGERTPKPRLLLKQMSHDFPPFGHYLVGFKGKLTDTQDRRSVTHLSAVWRSMSCYHYEWILRDGMFHSSSHRREQNIAMLSENSSGDDEDGDDDEYSDIESEEDVEDEWEDHDNLIYE